ncbi:vesicle-associated protein 1-4-like [Asparagus officinalis]|uniref:vesicle-associated protein 1-4-like n=1 Tax=Asparagus officinalis TaxID=4686 RepID=UPI00098E7819|nr:vesicle-associated protein 1-4-like [Asparagus officinalis]
MATGKLIQVDPPELRFPFESRRRIPCYIMLTNKTDDHVAFSLRSDAVEKYITQPNREIILPRSTCKVEVIMLPRWKAPHRQEDIEVHSVVTFAGAGVDDIKCKWFTKKADNKLDIVTLQVVCVFPTSIHRRLDLKTTTGKLIEVKPTKIRFPFELRKQITCSIFISNKTDDHIAFTLTSTNCCDYSVRPSKGILLPRSTCELIFLTEEQRKAPRNMRCDVSFCVNAVVTFAGATVKDVAHYKMFFRESGNTVDEVELKAIYVSPPKTPPPVPERRDKGSLYWASAKANLRKFYNGLARRRMWKSYTKINSDSDLMREPLSVSSSTQTES